jgi:hypothetical protein
MDLSHFRKKNDIKTGEGSGIFEYRNLREFEKVLFLEHNVKELIELLKRKDEHIKKLNDVIHNNEDSSKVKRMKQTITDNLATIKKYKTLYENLLIKFKR